MKQHGIRILFCAALALLLPFGCVKGTHEEALLNTPAPTEEPTEVPLEPTPTPWAGEGHWYTFQQFWIDDSNFGLSRVNMDSYLPLPYPYLIYTEYGVAIGKVKTYFEAKVYTNDPQERIIWLPDNGIDEWLFGAFVRSGVTLPKPEPESNDICLDRYGFFITLTEDAKAELLSLLAQAESGDVLKTGETINSLAHISCRFADFPSLGYEYKTFLASDQEGRRYLVRYSGLTQITDTSYRSLYDYLIEIEPSGMLYSEIDRLQVGIAADKTKPQNGVYDFNIIPGYYMRETDAP